MVPLLNWIYKLLTKKVNRMCVVNNKFKNTPLFIPRAFFSTLYFLYTQARQIIAIQVTIF